MTDAEKEMLADKIELRELCELFNLSRPSISRYFNLPGAPSTQIYKRRSYADRKAALEWMKRPHKRQRNENRLRVG